MKKYVVLSFAMFAALLAGCTEEPTGSGGGVVQFAIDVESPKLLQQQAPDSVHLTVIASDMETVSIGEPLDSTGIFEIQVEIPVGRNRTFILELYNLVVGAPQQVSATRLYAGQTTMDVVPSGVTTVPITLIPTVPMLKLTPMLSRVTAGDTVKLELKAYNMPGLSGVNAVFTYGYGLYVGGSNVVDPLPGTAPSWFPSSEYFYAGGYYDNMLYRVTITDSSGGEFPLSSSGTTLATIPLATREFTDSGGLPPQVVLLEFDQSQSWVTLPGFFPADVWFETSELIIDPIKDSILTFPDPTFRDVVAYNLYGTTIADVYLSQALKMYRIDMVEWPVNSIEGIGQLRYLSNVSAGYNNFSDLRPLADLKELYSLSVMGNGVTDISPLAGLTSLGQLNLYSNAITDITALSGKQSLWDLDLSYNQISNIGPLATATQLWRVYLQSNQISDLSALQNLTALHYLDLSGNQITDITALVNNPGLAAGDTVMLLANPLSVEAAEIQVRALLQRGVYVTQGM